MDFLNDFLKEVSHHFQEDFLIFQEEMLRIKNQLVTVLKSDCIKLQEELRRVGVPRDKMFPHSVQVVSSSPVVTCETCRQAVSLEFAVTCCGCNQGTHAECHTQLVIGYRFYMKMCFCCTNYVRHLLRVVRGFEQRSFHTWREDEWFRIVLSAYRTGSALMETNNQALIVLQICLMDSLRNELYVWEVNPRLNPPSEPPRSALPPLRTPTEDADPSPTGLL